MTIIMTIVTNSMKIATFFLPKSAITVSKLTGYREWILWIHLLVWILVIWIEVKKKAFSSIMSILDFVVFCKFSIQTYRKFAFFRALIKYNGPSKI